MIFRLNVIINLVLLFSQVDADSLVIMSADIEYLQYKFHIKNTYSTANDETLTGSCASTYT